MTATNGRGANPERVALYLRVSSDEQRCGLTCTGRTSTARVSGGSKKYSYYGCVSYRTDRGGGALPHRAPNIPAEWLEELVWADLRAFLADPGEVLERVRERMASVGTITPSSRNAATPSKGGSQRPRASWIGSSTSTPPER